MRAVQYRSMMSSSDAIIWNIERDPQLRSTVMVVWELDRVPQPARMSASVDRMIRSIPRLRQCVVEGRPRPSWIEVDDLDLAHHFVELEMAGGSSFDDAVAFAESWVAEPFDRAQPLWRLALLTGLPDGRAAIVIKVHHAIADGIGMVLMLGAFADLEADPPPVPLDNVIALPDKREAFGSLRRIGHKTASAAQAFVSSPVGATARAGRTIGSAARLVTPRRTPLGPVIGDRSGRLRLETRTIPLADLKSAATAAEASLNDLFVTVVADAVRQYHRTGGRRCPQLRFHIPVNSRTVRTAELAGNEFVPARVTLDLEHAGHDLLARVRDQLADLRREPVLPHLNSISAAVHRLGRATSARVIGGMMKGVDVLASNVPGPPVPLYLAGSCIERIVAFGPPAGAALNVTLFSYDGMAELGITVDEAAFVNHARFLDCFDEALATRVRLATPDSIAV